MSERAEVEVILPSHGEIEIVRGLWHEYWTWLALPPDFQGFAHELQTLPGVYAPPTGRLLIALIDGKPTGTAAFRRLTDQACEAKRLFVRPQYRRRGVAGLLLDRLVAEARAAGYREIYGDTLESMQPALNMYRRLGFTEVAAYSENPTPGAVFLRLLLSVKS